MYFKQKTCLEKMLSDKGKKSQTSKYLKGDYKKGGESTFYLGR